jgi:hypothetical protein
VTNSASLTVNQNVAVTSAPVSVTNCPGNNVTFNVGATGTGLSYAWVRNGSVIGTGSSLLLSNISATDAGTYSVVVSGTCGAAVTNSASLTVNQNVLVTSAPVSVTNCPGSSVTFNVGATGTGLSYAWVRNGLVIGTGSSLLLSNISATDAGNYSVVVSGTCGAAVTNSASLTVNQNVLVTSAPVSVTNCPGSSVTFNVGATGTGLSYAWLRNGSVIGTGSSLQLNSISAADAGTYSVVVSGTCGNAVTNSASLAVNENVMVVSAPVSLTNCPGTSASFAVSATGTGLSYQWYKGAGALAGQTGNSLMLANVSASDAGTYSVVVSGTCGNAVTSSASLTVNQNVLVTSAPVSVTNCPGSSVTFNVGATGTGLSYAWLRNGSVIGTGSSLVLNSISVTDAGNYSVVVSGTCGAAVTNSASLTVNQNVVVTSAPVSLTNCPGTSASFTVSATGTGLSYQWYKGAGALAGQMGSTLLLSSVSAADAGTYSVVISGACGTVTPTPAVLTVNASTVAAPLSSLTNNLGTSVTFTTAASGTGLLTYVWKKNGTNITGATTTSLTLTNLAYDDGGVYSVVVTGACGTAVQSATLTINIPPTVSIVSPTNGTVFIAPANFTVLADARDVDGVVTNVQFFQGTTNELGEVSNPGPYGIILTNVPTGSYTFTAKATDNLGASGVSAPVTITVIPSPPLSIVSAMTYNPQTDLFQQTVRVFNPTYSTYDAVRVYVYGLTNNTTVYNASGSTNGVPYVESQVSILPGRYVDFVIEYYTPLRIMPNPTLLAELVNGTGGGTATVSGTAQHINRGIMLPDKTFLIEFASIANRVYYIQYSSDLRTWKTAQQAITGNGTELQWVDNGEPQTESAPTTTSLRFYRLIMLP